jgi:hypothetical protein
MFGWLFDSEVVEIVPETAFSSLPIGQEFKKVDAWDCEVTYVKTNEREYETIENGYHCIKWYRVHEDFLVNI